MIVGNNLHNYCIRNDTNETLKSVIYGQRKLNNCLWGTTTLK